MGFMETGSELPVFKDARIGVDELLHIITEKWGDNGATTGAADQTHWILDVINAFSVFRKFYGENCAAMAAPKIKEIQNCHPLPLDCIS